MKILGDVENFQVNYLDSSEVRGIVRFVSGARREMQRCALNGERAPGNCRCDRGLANEWKLEDSCTRHVVRMRKGIKNVSKIFFPGRNGRPKHVVRVQAKFSDVPQVLRYGRKLWAQRSFPDLITWIYKCKCRTAAKRKEIQAWYTSRVERGKKFSSGSSPSCGSWSDRHNRDCRPTTADELSSKQKRHL